MPKQPPKVVSKKRREQMRQWRAANPEKAKESTRKAQAAYARRHPKRIMLKAARIRARKKGIPFSITEHDFEVPEKCPVLGIKLVRGEQSGHSDASPSIDRIVPELGYVPGNVAVISGRINRIKCDATLEEIQALAKWLKKMLPK